MIKFNRKRPARPLGHLAEMLGIMKNPKPREPRWAGDSPYPSGGERGPFIAAQIREEMRGMTLAEIEEAIEDQRKYVNDLSYEERDARELLQYIRSIKNGTAGLV